MDERLIRGGIGMLGQYGNAALQAQQAQTCEKRRSAADEVIQMAESICSRALSIADDAELKLSPLVLRQDVNQCPGPALSEMPAFFDALRDKLSGIDSALDRIYLTVDRVDL